VNFADIMKVAAGIIASVGCAGVIILGLSSWLGKVWADRISLKTSARYEQEIEELRNRYNTELELSRAEIAERRDFMNSLYKSMSGGYLLSHQCILDSIAVLWKKTLEMRELTSGILFMYAILLPEEVETLPIEKIFDMSIEMTIKDLTFSAHSITTEVEQVRPFIGESLWRIYNIYQTFSGRLALKVLKGKSEGKIYNWNRTNDGEYDEALFRALQFIFTEDELREIKDISIGAPQRIIGAIETKMLNEMNELTFGKHLVSFSIEEQQRIASLMEPLRPLKRNQQNAT
jgi:hypothetical protein